MQSIRRYDLDWLRIAGVFLVIVFHTMMVFILEPWAVVYIKDREFIHAFKPVSSFIHIFHMPLMFVIAGMSVRFSIEKRTTKEFLQERFCKLFLPAVFGCIFLNPIMTYIYRISQGDKKNYVEHVVGYFTENPGDLSGIEGGFTPAHFWFLIYLFLFSCIGLPLFFYWKRKNRLLFVPAKCLLMFAIPLTIVSFINLLDDKNPFPYFLYFIFGYYLISNDKYREALKKDKFIYGFIGILCGYLAITIGEKTAVTLLTQIASLSIIFALIGLGDTYWNKNSKVLRYLSAASFPIYMIHMLLNTVIGFFVVKLPVPAMTKFFIILILTILGSLAVYECMRRIREKQEEHYVRNYTDSGGSK